MGLWGLVDALGWFVEKDRIQRQRREPGAGSRSGTVGSGTVRRRNKSLPSSGANLAGASLAEFPDQNGHALALIANVALELVR